MNVTMQDRDVLGSGWIPQPDDTAESYVDGHDWSDSHYWDAYQTQVFNALSRGIDWRFTFQTWMHFWGSEIDQRGREAGQLVMARRGDTGPYSPENCIRILNRVNTKHGARRAKLARLRGQA